ncbi:dynamin family protein [Aliarcobacter cryaerophilus]|uniref:dynamin family protein n=1 Tax=Aliarcobacter cryaerophilus TaxID=28198 RepID=UPI003DA23D56
MIKTQKKYIDYLEVVTDQLQNINIDTSRYKDYILKIKNTELIVPVVGGFSAGKSTLINHYLGDEILSTSLTPETALATELRYSSKNYIQAIKSDESFDIFELNQSNEIKDNAAKYKYLKLYLNNDKLKLIEPLVLVDMPGFDSPLELHNHAILNYLNKGIYFVVLTSIEDGNLTKSTLRELQNMVEFGKDFSFCLSKSNLRSENDVRDVKEKINSQLEDYFDFDKKVIPLYQNGGNELEKILTSINTEELFEKIFKQDLKYNYLEIESSINTIISTLKVSKEEVANALIELKNSIKKIISKKESMIEEAQSKYSNNSVDSIIEAVSRELLINQDSLVQMALSNKEGFSRELNDIVKNTMIYQVKSKLNEASDDIIKDFSIEIRDIGASLSSFNFGDNWVNTISESTTNLLRNAQNGLNTLIESRKKQNEDNGKVYKSITATLAITSELIHPVLEVVILFLPEIIAFFSAKSQEAKMKQEMYNKFSSQIIPSIKTKLRGELPSIFTSQINSIIETISEKFEEQLQQKEIEIAKTQEEKQNDIKEIEIKLTKLEETKQKIKQTATNTLYEGIK